MFSDMSLGACITAQTRKRAPIYRECTRVRITVSEGECEPLLLALGARDTPPAHLKTNEKIAPTPAMRSLLSNPRRARRSRRPWFNYRKREAQYTKHNKRAGNKREKGTVLTEHMREAAVGSQQSRFTCASQRFLRLESAGKRNIRVPFLQWFEHCGTQHPGIAAA